MSKKEFAEFISRQRPPVVKEEKAIDWNTEKAEWLKHLSDLYRMIESFLKDYIDSGNIVLEYSNIEITEDNIGRYTVKAMKLSFGTNNITFTPIGTLLIGTKGRVDMAGPKGTVRLLLADKDSTRLRITVTVRDTNMPAVEEVPKPINWEWKIAIMNAPKRGVSYQKLTQETFLNAIMELSNG
jgi:hypothetical protein